MASILILMGEYLWDFTKTQLSMKMFWWMKPQWVSRIMAKWFALPTYMTIVFVQNASRKNQGIGKSVIASMALSQPSG